MYHVTAQDHSAKEEQAGHSARAISQSLARRSLSSVSLSRTDSGPIKNNLIFCGTDLISTMMKNDSMENHAMDEEDATGPTRSGDGSNSGSPYVPHRKSVTATDAEFLDMVDTTAADRVVDLHKSNLLRLQMDELLNETVLSLDPTDSTMTRALSSSSAKWVAIANDYVQDIRRILQDNISLSDIAVQDPACPFAFRSDKHRTWKNLSSKSKLKVQPKGCYAANMGFTKLFGNAQVLPTLELMVLLPTRDIMESKDYMKYRCIDVRMCVSIGDFVAQESELLKP